MEVQLLMKQGQVEINPGAYVHNFKHCLLLDRKVVESLNKIIQSHGKQKISIMVDSKDFRKGITQLEWLVILIKNLRILILVSAFSQFY